jgi:vancomycin permeability regulator SanA
MINLLQKTYKIIFKYKKNILRFLLICCSLFLIGIICIIYDGLHDNIFDADIIIVLGNKVNPDGVPSLQLKSRLEKAAEVYNQGRAKLIFVSGGFGKEGFDEAIVMSKYLIQMQIPKATIIIDSQGIDTMSTAINASQFIKDQHFTSALIITQYFHISRSKLALKKMGVSNLGHAHAEYFSIRDFYSLPREVIAYLSYLFK